VKCRQVKAREASTGTCARAQEAHTFALTEHPRSMRCLQLQVKVGCACKRGRQARGRQNTGGGLRTAFPRLHAGCCARVVLAARHLFCGATSCARRATLTPPRAPALFPPPRHGRAAFPRVSSPPAPPRRHVPTTPVPRRRRACSPRRLRSARGTRPWLSAGTAQTGNRTWAGGSVRRTDGDMQCAAGSRAASDLYRSTWGDCPSTHELEGLLLNKSTVKG